MFTSRAEITRAAADLIQSLADLKDASGNTWTQENFRRLEQFALRINPSLQSYYRRRGQKKEFLWDFIASSIEAGIVIAAESEQAVANENDLGAC